MSAARELALLPDGAHAGQRGLACKLVEHRSLVADLTAGAIRAALDVTDPSRGPPIIRSGVIPGVLISAAVGGASSAFFPRADRLMAAQLTGFHGGRPLNSSGGLGRGHLGVTARRCQQLEWSPDSTMRPWSSTTI